MRFLDVSIIDKPYTLNNKRKINVYLQAGNVSPSYSFMLCIRHYWSFYHLILFLRCRPKMSLDVTYINNALIIFDYT